MTTQYEIIKSALEQLPEATEQQADVLYKKIQNAFIVEEPAIITRVKKVYLIHDNIYFSNKIARLFDDGKESPVVRYIIVQPGEVAYEGACDFPLFESEEDAWEELEAESGELHE